MFSMRSSAGKRRWAHDDSGYGFTLIELVIVMSMMVILVGIVAPRIEVSASRRVGAQAQQIVAHLELARSKALGTRMMTQVTFDATGGSYAAYVDHDRDGNIAHSADEMLAFPEFGDRDLERLVEFGRGNASTIPGDPSLDAVTLTSAQLELSVRGVPEPWGTMGTVYLVHRDDKNAVMAISISPSGSFRAWRWFSGAWQ